MLEVISREEAKAAGLKRYYTGVPCANGHLSERYSVNGKCCTCRSNVKKVSYAKIKGAPVRVSIKRTPEEKSQAIKIYVKNWKRSNPDRHAAHKAKRRAKKLKATPKWLTKEHWEQIDAFYIEARRMGRETGVIYHVDHIIPLNGETVCGLHVPWNLQILTAEDNLRKSNKVEEDACG